MKVVPHTAGPWVVEDHAPLRDGQFYLEVATPHVLPDGGYPMLVCTIQPTTTHDRGPDPEQRANAALIASAPTLRALLERASKESVYDASYCVSCGMGACDEEGNSDDHDEDCWVRLAKDLLSATSNGDDR